MKISELIKVINATTPLELAFDDDKVGLLIGSKENEVYFVGNVGQED